MKNVLVQACCIFALLVSSSVGAQEKVAPGKSDGRLESAATTQEIKSWVEARKVFGFPQYVEARLVNLEVFVIWNIPTSGWNGTDYWVYCRSERAFWSLIEGSWFQPKVDMAHSVLVDPQRRTVTFLGPDGETFKTVSVQACPRD
jgi:hypothetical protein